MLTCIDLWGLYCNKSFIPKKLNNKIKDVHAGNDIESSSFKQADQALNGAFPNARIITGAGNKSASQTSRQKKDFKLIKDGTSDGHENLPNGHPRQATSRINVITPNGKRVTIYIER